MKRRSNGEGSFYQQKDKSWVYQVTYGRKEDGKLFRKSFKGRTKTICKERRAQWEEEQARIKAEEEAQAAESAHLEELRAKLGHPIESEVLFSEAFPKWLDLYKSPPARKPSIRTFTRANGRIAQKVIIRLAEEYDSSAEIGTRERSAYAAFPLLVF